MWAAVTDAVQHVGEPPGGCSLPEGPVEASDAQLSHKRASWTSPRSLPESTRCPPPAREAQLKPPGCLLCGASLPVPFYLHCHLPRAPCPQPRTQDCPDLLHPSSSQGRRHTRPLLPTRPVSPHLRVYHPKAPDEGGFPHSQHSVNKDFVSASRAEDSRFPEWTR